MSICDTAAPTAEPAASSPVLRTAAYFRSMGDTYAKFAADSNYDLAKSANAAESSKYYGIAARLENASDSND